MPANIAIAGASGRMGRMLIELLSQTEGLALAAAGIGPGEPLLGQDAGLVATGTPLNVVFSDDPAVLTRKGAVDVVIDFTTPAFTAALASACASNGVALVTGTTGLKGAHQQAVERAATAVPIMQAANMSLGVTLLLALAERASAALPASFDIEITEAHHRAKADAPSGTALALGRAAAAGRGLDLATEAVFDRHAAPGARRPGSIGFGALRGGDVVGEHTVFFFGQGERIELTHRATDRRIFAAGALQAATWLAAGRTPGLYAMKDVLGLG